MPRPDQEPPTEDIKTSYTFWTSAEIQLSEHVNSKGTEISWAQEEKQHQFVQLPLKPHHHHFTITCVSR